MSTQNTFSARLRRVVDRAGGVGAVAKATDVSPGAVYGWLMRRAELRTVPLKYGVDKKKKPRP